MKAIPSITPLPELPTPGVEISEWKELKKFFRVSSLFVAGLALILFGADRVTGVFLEKSGHRGGIAPDVQRAADAARVDARSTPIIVLGDSVARQLFTLGTEPSNDVHYLTSNQAVTMAGQYYLARDAMEHSPHLTDIYLLLLPPVWANNMSRAYTHDYFCGHFHTFGEVAEVFFVKRDIELSFAHLGRFVMPNLMAANSLSQPASALETGPIGPQRADAPPPADPERWLTEISEQLGPKTDPAPIVPAGTRAVTLSPVSKYYLERLRADCRKRGIRLHLFPSPVSAVARGYVYVDPLSIYDGPIFNDVPAEQLLDGIHFKKAFIPAMRQRMIDSYGLDFARPIQNKRELP